MGLSWTRATGGNEVPGDREVRDAIWGKRAGSELLRMDVVWMPHKGSEKAAVA